MKTGDLIEHDGGRWFVVKYDEGIRVGLLVNPQGTRKELANDDPDCKVLTNPPESWPTLSAPIRSGAGPFVKLTIPSLPGRPDRELEPWVHWIQSDPARDGGSLFVSPDARLGPGVVLIATHRNGATVRITVTRAYGTVAHRQAAATRLPPEPINRFNRILDDDDEA